MLCIGPTGSKTYHKRSIWESSGPIYFEGLVQVSRPDQPCWLNMVKGQSFIGHLVQTQNLDNFHHHGRHNDSRRSIPRCLDSSWTNPSLNHNIPALHLVNEQRSAHGLRYDDFHRYRWVWPLPQDISNATDRNHCANRTHRLRSTLKLTHGKGREFKKLPPLTPDVIRDGQ